MKKFFIVMCMMLASATSFAQKGEMDLGIHAGFMLDSPNNLGIGANIGYMLTNNIRGVGEFNYFLKKDDVSWWDVRWCYGGIGSRSTGRTWRRRRRQRMFFCFATLITRRVGYGRGGS